MVALIQPRPRRARPGASPSFTAILDQLHAFHRTTVQVSYEAFFVQGLSRARARRSVRPTSTRARGSPGRASADLRIPFSRFLPSAAPRRLASSVRHLKDSHLSFLGGRKYQGLPGLRRRCTPTRRRQARLAVRRGFRVRQRARLCARKARLLEVLLDARVAATVKRRVRGRRARFTSGASRTTRRGARGRAGRRARARGSGWRGRARRRRGPRPRTRAEGRGGKRCDLRRTAGGAIGRWWRWSARRAAVVSEEAFAAIRPRAMSSSLPTRTREVLRANAKGLARGVVRRADRHRHVSGARKHRDEGHRAVRARATLCSAKRPARVEMYWLFVPPRKSHSRARAR